MHDDFVRLKFSTRLVQTAARTREIDTIAAGLYVRTHGWYALRFTVRSCRRRLRATRVPRP